MEGASRICLIYQVVCYYEDDDSEETARTYYEALNQTLLTQKYRGSPPYTFYGLEVYGTQLEVARLKKANFFISNFKIYACFLDCTT